MPNAEIVTCTAGSGAIRRWGRRILQGAGSVLLIGSCLSEPPTDGTDQEADPPPQIETAADTVLLDLPTPTPQASCQTASCCPIGLPVIEGDEGPDKLKGNSNQQCIVGLGGDDTITAGAAGDYVLCGDGDDTCKGAGGDDVLLGGRGVDHVLGGGGDDFIDGGDDHDDLSGGGGDDLIYGRNGSDEILGGTGLDRIDAGRGDDDINGAGGADHIIGGFGNDTISGGGDADLIVPGPGVDTVLAGGGDDTILIRAACDVGAGETIGGSGGTDTVVSPYTQAELEALGVTFTSVEVFQVVVPQETGACSLNLDDELVCDCCDSGEGPLCDSEQREGPVTEPLVRLSWVEVPLETSVAVVATPTITLQFDKVSTPALSVDVQIWFDPGDPNAAQSTALNLQLPAGPQTTTAAVDLAATVDLDVLDFSAATYAHAIVRDGAGTLLSHEFSPAVYFHRADPGQSSSATAYGQRALVTNFDAGDIKGIFAAVAGSGNVGLVRRATGTSGLPFAAGPPLPGGEEEESPPFP